MKMLQRLDHAAKMFSGVFTYIELLNMPLYMYEYILAARHKQLEEAQEQYERTGTANIYMQQTDANQAMTAMTAALGGLAAGKGAQRPPKEVARENYTQKDFLKELRRNAGR